MISAFTRFCRSGITSGVITRKAANEAIVIRIYNIPAPTRALRPIWLCEEMGLPYKVEPVTFPPGAEYRARYGLGKLPFLEDGDVAMGESVAMLFYLAEKYGPTPLLPAKNDPVYPHVLNVTIFSEATLASGMNPLLATHFYAPEDKKENWLKDYTEGRCEANLVYADELLGKGPYVAGERFTIADIALVMSLGMWTSPVLKKRVSENLAAYQARLLERPTLQRALQRAVGK
jgi:glutathione S-transferase